MNRLVEDRITLSVSQGKGLAISEVTKHVLKEGK
jgi:hypothetical protein